MLLLMIGVRLSECCLRMHNPGDALDSANQLLALTAFRDNADYVTARHILHVVKALSALELGLSFNAAIDVHQLVQTAPEHRRQSCMHFARRVASKIAFGNNGGDASTESCCSNARKRTRRAVSEVTTTTCSSAHEDDVQDTAVSSKYTTKRYRVV